MIVFFKHQWFFPALGIFFIGGLAGCAGLPSRPPFEKTELPAGAPNSVAVSSTRTLTTVSRAESTLTLVAGGDVLPGGWLEPYFKQHGEAYPYKNLAPVFKQADLGLVNLECPISTRGKAQQGKQFTFRARPETAPALLAAGINAVSLANNHILDYGPSALADTLETLKKTGIFFSGAGPSLSAALAPCRIEIPHTPRVALFSFSLTYPESFWAGVKKPGTAPALLADMQKQLSLARNWAQIILVCFHWGGELVPEPRAYQVQFGHAAIDAGASIVIGTHPHILQGVERYHSGLIFYSLGNLVFGGGKSKNAVDSALIAVSFSATGNWTSARILPLSVDNEATRFQPVQARGAQADRILNALLLRAPGLDLRLMTLPDGWAEILPAEENQN